MKYYIQGSLYPELPLFTESALHKMLEPIYPHLWRTIMEPWLEFQRYRETDPNFSDFCEEDAAQFLHSLIKARMRVVFENNPVGAFVSTFYGKPTVIIPDKLAVTVKKLKKRRPKPDEPAELTRSHYDTPRARKYWSNQPVDDGPTEPRVIVGYILVRELTQIKILVGYPRIKRKSFIWSYLMPEQPASILQARFTQEAFDQSVTEKGFKIDAKEIGKEGTTDGQG
jgi:hypothetical protein